MTEKLECLIIRQPYASLIAFGFKRWEFRSYDAKKIGKIGIAASNAPPLYTKCEELNHISHLFPKNMVLATANLTASFLVNSNDLNQYVTDLVTVNLHGNKIKTLGEPIGEPIEDVLAAIANSKWESFSWLLENVNPLSDPIHFNRSSPLTWITIEV